MALRSKNVSMRDKRAEAFYHTYLAGEIGAILARLAHVEWSTET